MISAHQTFANEMNFSFQLEQTFYLGEITNTFNDLLPFLIQMPQLQETTIYSVSPSIAVQMTVHSPQMRDCLSNLRPFFLSISFGERCMIKHLFADILQFVARCNREYWKSRFMPTVYLSKKQKLYF